MPIEKEAYRDNVERLKSFFPDKELLNMKEVSDFCGIDVRTVKKLLNINDKYISIASLARKLSY